jgi:hypothetical protein
MPKETDLKKLATGATFLADSSKFVEDTQQIDIVILVEAKPDERLYRQFFEKNCSFQSCNGKEKVLETLEKKKQHPNSHTIAIVDADFDRITNKNQGLAPLFLTDFHDREIMLLEAKEVWESILSEYGDADKIQQFEQKTPCKKAILEAARTIAYYRLLNEQEASITLTFNSGTQDKPSYLKYEKFVDKQTLTITEKELRKQIENKSNSQGLFKNNPQYLELIDAIKAKNYPILELCNGHDVLNILVLALHGTLGPSKEKQEEKTISRTAAVAYRLSDFQTTQLYQDLKTHFEQQNYSMPLKTA